ncbi:MAG: hypothetical protein EP330_30160 [Deltaproteobacteria bacterium]|nr:MAG: hypothetical protein EP330_30160 [Deltaproteobacteria bacterium]
MKTAYDPWLLFLLALGVHVGWSLQVPAPTDVDPSYYRLVAGHIAAGDGAVTTAVWQLLAAPESLPAPADLYWMPLPSRVLVPGLALWPAWGAELTNAAIAALWAPIAWLLARELGGQRVSNAGAALLAMWVPGFLRKMDQPDSIALFGAVGGLAFLAASRDKWGWAAVACALAALTRNDGLLLAPCIALAFTGWRMLPVAASGPLASALWTWRSASLGGEGYLAARSTIGQLADKQGLLGAEPTTLAASERLAFLWSDGIGVILVVLLLVMPLPGVFALPSRLREHPVTRAGLAYALGMPVFAVLAAPAVATYGSLYRSSSALVPLLAATSAVALTSFGTWSHARFKLHPAALPVSILGGWLALITLAGPAKPPTRPTPLGEAECALLGEVDGPVFTADPLFLAERCGRPAVLHSAHQSPEQRAELADRYGIAWALAPREGDEREHAMTTPDAGWEVAGERLWRRTP